MTRWGLLVGCVMAMVFGKKSSPFMLYPAPRQEGALSPTVECSTRNWFESFVRAKFSFSLNTHGPSERELVNKVLD